jgi:hypothetical protein
VFKNYYVRHEKFQFQRVRGIWELNLERRKKKTLHSGKFGGHLSYQRKKKQGGERMCEKEKRRKKWKKERKVSYEGSEGWDVLL